jgi:hypothetical protein
VVAGRAPASGSIPASRGGRGSSSTRCGDSSFTANSTRRYDARREPGLFDDNHSLHPGDSRRTQPMQVDAGRDAPAEIVSPVPVHGILGWAENRATGPPGPAFPSNAESAFIVPFQKSSVKESTIGARHPPYALALGETPPLPGPGRPPGASGGVITGMLVVGPGLLGVAAHPCRPPRHRDRRLAGVMYWRRTTRPDWSTKAFAHVPCTRFHAGCAKEVIVRNS